MGIRFYIDPVTDEPHIFGHKVTEEEAIDVLENSGEDRPAHDGARVAMGQTRAGRYLRVIYVPERDGAFIITAFELTGKPLLAYRRRRGRRQK